MIPASPPTVEEVRARYEVPSSVDDDELGDVLAAELDAQADACRIDPYTASLRAAAFRRCQRALAAKGVPLGVQITEFGTSSLRSVDVEIQRLEGPRRKFNIGSRRPEVTPHGRA